MSEFSPSLYPCCKHCPEHHTSLTSPWANQGHTYPCRDIYCAGFIPEEKK